MVDHSKFGFKEGLKIIMLKLYIYIYIYMIYHVFLEGSSL
jgi:hypothetical protein